MNVAHSIFYKLGLGLILSSACMNVHAQSIDDLVPDLTTEERKEISKAFGQYASATTIFTGRNAASTGNFSFDDNGGDFSVANIPYSVRTGEETDEIRLEGRVAVGQFEGRSSIEDFSEITSEIEDSLPPEFQGENNRPDFRKDLATTLTVGTGVVFQPVKGLRITPGFDVLWTHVKRRFDYNNFASALIGVKYDRDVFNYSTEAISYSPNINIAYNIDLGDQYSVTPLATYTHIWSQDLWSKSSLADFSINSGVLHTGISGNIPLPCTSFGYDVALQPAIRRTTLYKGARAALGDDAIWDLGTDFVFDLGEEGTLKAFRLGAAYLTADVLTGYRINVGVDF